MQVPAPVPPAPAPVPVPVSPTPEVIVPAPQVTPVPVPPACYTYELIYYTVPEISGSKNPTDNLDNCFFLCTDLCTGFVYEKVAMLCIIYTEDLNNISTSFNRFADLYVRQCGM